jgi:predicted transcriptional regulator
MRKRTSPEIIAEILSLCRSPQRKTRLQYAVNLSWRMLNQYLDQMQSLGLLEIHHSSVKYLATQKGRKFLEKWKEIAEITMSTHEKLEDART